MAERRPDLAREHRLHDRFRGPPRASPVRFQVSRPADRTSRGWARGVPLAECRFPGPATRRLGRLRRESERSTAPGICAPLRENLWWCVVVVVVAATPNYLRQASQNLGKYVQVENNVNLNTVELKNEMHEKRKSSDVDDFRDRLMTD